MSGRIIATLLAAAAVATIAGPAVSQSKPATDWEGKTVPVEVFAQFPMIANPTMSADGKWIAAKVRANGVQALAILSIGVAAPPRIIARDGDFDTDKQGERQIGSYRWIDSDHLLIQIVSRDNYLGEWFDNIRYASFNRATGKIVPLGWTDSLGATSVLWTSSSGPPRILLQRVNVRSSTEMWGNPEVLEIDADTGKTRVAMRANNEVGSWEVDEAGVVRMGSSRDSETGKVQVLYRPDESTPLKKVFDAVPDRYSGVELPEMMLGSGKAYSTSRKDGFTALYEYDLATMKLGKKLFGVDGYDISGASLSPDRTRIDSVNVITKRSTRIFFDPRLKEIQQVLDESFGAGNAFIATADARREKVVLSASAMGQPESWYLFDTVTGGMGRIAYANDTLKNAMLNPVSVVRYPASDGKTIEAILTMPRHRAGQKNLPLIVMPHGGPWARDDADWDVYGWAQALAEQGYVVIQPNYRGSTGYGSEWEKAAEKSWGYRMQDDLNDAVTWLAGQGTVDAKRVCMMGWSYGGYAASRAAQRDGASYRCAISGAGVHDLPAMVKYDKNYLGKYSARAGLGSAGTNLIDVSPGLHPEQYSIPILIVHGARDIRVPVAQSRDLVARLKKVGKVEGKDFVYIEQPLNTHNLLREADRMQLLTETLKFLQKHNPA